MRFLILLGIWCTCLISYGQQSDFKTISFAKADSIAQVHHGASLHHLPLLAYKLTKDLDTQVEQFRAIHTWVCSNIESDHYLNERIAKRLKKLHHNTPALQAWNKSIHKSFFKRLIEDKATVCIGYAYLIKTLSNASGISCEIVEGYSKILNKAVDIPNHSWNVVKLNHKWYVTDATWASGYYDISKDQFIKNYNDGYFLTAPELFSKNHYAKNPRWRLGDLTLTLEAFSKAPVVYNAAFKTKITPVSPQQLITTITAGTAVTFAYTFEETSPQKQMTLEISNKFKITTLPITAVAQHTRAELTHVFDKKGTYNVHAKIGNTVIASYTVKCKKKQPYNTL